MAITHATVEGHFESAVTSILADDYIAARRFVAAARTAFSSLPDSGIESASMRFDRRTDDVLVSIEKAEEAFNRNKVTARIARGVTRFRGAGRLG